MKIILTINKGRDGRTACRRLVGAPRSLCVQVTGDPPNKLLSSETLIESMI